MNRLLSIKTLFKDSMSEDSDIFKKSNLDRNIVGACLSNPGNLSNYTYILYGNSSDCDTSYAQIIGSGGQALLGGSVGNIAQIANAANFRAICNGSTDPAKFKIYRGDLNTIQRAVAAIGCSNADNGAYIFDGTDLVSKYDDCKAVAIKASITQVAVYTMHAFWNGMHNPSLDAHLSKVELSGDISAQSRLTSSGIGSERSYTIQYADLMTAMQMKVDYYRDVAEAAHSSGGSGTAAARAAASRYCGLLNSINTIFGGYNARSIVETWGESGVIHELREWAGENSDDGMINCALGHSMRLARALDASIEQEIREIVSNSRSFSNLPSIHQSCQGDGFVPPVADADGDDEDDSADTNTDRPSRPNRDRDSTHPNPNRAGTGTIERDESNNQVYMVRIPNIVRTEDRHPEGHPLAGQTIFESLEFDAEQIREMSSVIDQPDFPVALALLSTPVGRMFWDPDNISMGGYVEQPGSTIEERAKKALRMILLYSNSGYEDTRLGKTYRINRSNGMIDGLFRFMYQHQVVDTAEYEVQRAIDNGSLSWWRKRREIRATVRDKRIAFYRKYRYYGGQSFHDDAQSFTPQSRRQRWESGHRSGEYDVSQELRESDPDTWTVLTGGREHGDREDRVMNRGRIPRVDRSGGSSRRNVPNADDHISLSSRDIDDIRLKFKKVSRYKSIRSNTIKRYNKNSKIIK